jgi:hypothetical protein
MKRAAVLVAAAAVSLAWASSASASPGVQFGLQDDAWLEGGSIAAPLIEDRMLLLDRMGVDAVRYTLRWDWIAPTRPAHPSDPSDPAYQWARTDQVLDGLHLHGIDALVTLWGTPPWANGDHKPNWAPASPSALALFATAVAKRYPWIRKWEIWNEPNQRGGLMPNSPRLYVQRLLNGTTDALHALNPENRVAGGATSPRATRTALSAFSFMRGMRAAGARFDVYSHHPHPRRHETPFGNPKQKCTRWYTMSNLQCLLREVQRNFGPKRIWLTEFAYKTNPPDRYNGVSPALQARYTAESARRVYLAPRVDLLIHFLLRDEPVVGRWASGLFTVTGVAKPAFYAFTLPFAQVRRRGSQLSLWGQVRPRFGPQEYTLEQLVSGIWAPVGTTAVTNERGYFWRIVRARPGARFRIWSAMDSLASPPLLVR